MDAQNELNFRLARSQFFYEQAERKARAQKWSWLRNNFWLLIASAGFVVLALVGQAELVVVAIVLLGLGGVFAKFNKEFKNAQRDHRENLF